MMNSIQQSAKVSFAGLFGADINSLNVRRIEIPLIQRDFAQGRTSESAERIRETFLDALCSAIGSDEGSLSLDFVFGDVENGVEGAAFYPLDGQQRLTTLFLLHCYLAWRVGVSIEDEPWANFTYATRPGARHFCEMLVRVSPPDGESSISTWLEDQAWYLHTWRSDPTIQSMLVMLDAIHGCLAAWSGEKCRAAWQRLTDRERPAISFHLLPMKANGLTDDLYIKMNSRGKPLTVFENFKAHFEDMLNTVDPIRADDFAKKVDVAWADILWPYRGSDHLIDDEFMAYFRFVTDVLAWRNGVEFDAGMRTEKLADLVFSDQNCAAREHIDFLIHAFDVWSTAKLGVESIASEFDTYFTATPDGPASPVLIFNSFKGQPPEFSPVDLFGACCRYYGKDEWSHAHTLLMYSVVLHRMHAGRTGAGDFPRMLRIVRNLIEASLGGWIREANMPRLLADVERIIVGESMDGVSAFNPAQVAHEKDKLLIVAQLDAGTRGALYRLEDHRLLRGCLLAFDLDSIPSEPKRFASRVSAFYALFSNAQRWPELTGALLALGDYSRRESRWNGYRLADFGAPRNDKPWRELLSGTRKARLVTVLMALLDRYSAEKDFDACVQAIQTAFFAENREKLSWQYYLVKYPAMREGASGRYAIHDSGYRMCMLDKTVMRSYYHDPYLLAVLRLSGVGHAVVPPLFIGYETEDRRMTLKGSGIEIECEERGWRVYADSVTSDQQAKFEQLCREKGIDQDGLYAVPQGEDGIDSADRVKLGADLLRDLVEAGL
jgi:hypothetical protein